MWKKYRGPKTYSPLELISNRDKKGGEMIVQINSLNGHNKTIRWDSHIME